MNCRHRYFVWSHRNIKQLIYIIYIYIYWIFGICHRARASNIQPNRIDPIRFNFMLNRFLYAYHFWWLPQNSLWFSQYHLTHTHIWMRTAFAVFDRSIAVTPDWATQQEKCMIYTKRRYRRFTLFVHSEKCRRINFRLLLWNVKNKHLTLHYILIELIYEHIYATHRQTDIFGPYWYRSWLTSTYTRDFLL